MAITTYSELQTAVKTFSERPGDDVKNYIALAESGLNRELDAVETDATLTGTVDSRRIDISALSMIEPVAMFLTDSATGDEITLDQKADGTFPYMSTSGQPVFWAVDGDYIDFDVPLDTAYSFRLRYQGRFALSDAAPTNWLLTNHPDVYVAATMMWGFPDKEDWGNAAGWGKILSEGIRSVRSVLTQNKRGVLSPDTDLARMTRNRNNYGAYRG